MKNQMPEESLRAKERKRERKRERERRGRRRRERLQRIERLPPSSSVEEVKTRVNNVDAYDDDDDDNQCE